MERFAHFLKYFFKYIIQVIIGTGVVMLGVYLITSTTGILPFTGIIPLGTIFIMASWWYDHGRWM